MLGQLPRLRARATVGDRGEAVVRVVGREQTNVVTGVEELLGQCFDVSPDAPRIRVGLGGDERYAHAG